MRQKAKQMKERKKERKDKESILIERKKEERKKERKKEWKKQRSRFIMHERINEINGTNKWIKILKKRTHQWNNERSNWKK